MNNALVVKEAFGDSGLTLSWAQVPLNGLKHSFIKAIPQDQKS